MYFAYIDESGDDGIHNSPTSWFVINCVLIHDSNWLDTLNQLVSLRRDLKTRFDIKARDEIKGIHFRSNQGVFKGLHWSLQQRFDLYKELLEFQEHPISIKTFSVAIKKYEAFNRGFIPLQAAWKFTFERIQKFCQNEKERAIIFHDEGKGQFIQRTLRFMRRHNYISKHYSKGSISFTVSNILEDPTERKSEHSYFIQLADWNAYVAHRSKYIDPVKRISPNLWDCLGSALLLPVNKLRGGPPGIVVYP
ncbi:MAG: DUF3800 domain-containing protein [Candidatus Zixiibacteriota bacterium]